MVAPVPLAHDATGPRNGPTLVLLHGFPLDHTMWQEQAAAAAAEGWRVLLPDLRGHGRSPVASPATMEAHVADVADLLDRSGVTACVLGGFSLGGYVALEFIRRHPGRVRGLILADTRAEPDTPEAQGKRAETADRVRREGTRVLEQSMMPKLLTEATRRDRPDRVEPVKASILATPAEGAAQALLGMAQRPDQRPHLATIHVPVLVLVGEADELTPPTASEAMARVLPDAKLVRIAGAAHLAPWEAPEAFNQELMRWLAPLR
jgi:3-oxoadipate enol-lactonase